MWQLEFLEVELNQELDFVGLHCALDSQRGDHSEPIFPLCPGQQQCFGKLLGMSGALTPKILNMEDDLK